MIKLVNNNAGTLQFEALEETNIFIFNRYLVLGFYMVLLVNRSFKRVHTEALLFTISFISFSYCCRFFINSTKRCPTDSTLDYSYNPTRHYQQFKIRAFRFWNDYDTVYFHCELLACHRNYPDSRLVSNYSVTLQTREVGLNSPCWISESCKMCQPTFLFLVWLLSNRWNAFTKNIKSGLSDVIDEFCEW